MASSQQMRALREAEMDLFKGNLLSARMDKVIIACIPGREGEELSQSHAVKYQDILDSPRAYATERNEYISPLDDERGT